MSTKSKRKFGHKKAVDKRDIAETKSKLPIRPFRKRGRAPMPDGSGAVVLFEKRAGGLRSVAVIALKAVLPEPDNTPAWTAVANVLMPHQLALGFREPVWTELLKFGAYKKQANRTRRSVT
jgi:hypothetical protein